MARGQRSGWRSTRRRRISYGACWPEVFRIYLPSVLRSSGSSPAPHSQVQLISQLIYLTTHLSHNSSLNLSHNSSHNSSYNRSLLYISVCLSVYLFFFFNTVHLSQLLCLLFYDWRCISHLVSLYLLFTCRTLLFYDIFSCICFTQIIDGFVYLPFNFSNMSYDFSDSCENFSCLPAFNVGKGGGTPVRLSSLTSLTLFITKSKPLRRVCSHNLEESTRTTRGPVCFRPKYVCGR